MPRIKLNEYSMDGEYSEKYEYIDECEMLLIDNQHVVKFLKDNFGIPKYMLEAHPCAGDESIFIKFKGQSYWLFEFDEEQSYDSAEWYNHVQYRIAAAYEQMEKLIIKMD